MHLQGLKQYHTPALGSTGRLDLLLGGLSRPGGVPVAQRGQRKEWVNQALSLLRPSASLPFPASMQLNFPLVILPAVMVFAQLFILDSQQKLSVTIREGSVAVSLASGGPPF